VHSPLPSDIVVLLPTEALLLPGGTLYCLHWKQGRGARIRKNGGLLVEVSFYIHKSTTTTTTPTPTHILQRDSHALSYSRPIAHTLSHTHNFSHTNTNTNTHTLTLSSTHTRSSTHSLKYCNSPTHLHQHQDQKQQAMTSVWEKIRKTQVFSWPFFPYPWHQAFPFACYTRQQTCPPCPWWKGPHFVSSSLQSKLLTL